MRTKHLLLSTVLAATAFTACTNEDLVSTPVGVDLGGEKVNVSILASKGANNVDTRIGLDPTEEGKLTGTPYWENGDMLGGLLYTNASGTNMLTNYPFTPAEEIGKDEKPTAMTFTTPTAVSKGNYVFYTPYKKKYVDNGKFEVTLPDRQEMDPANPTAHLMDNNFMISPTVSLAGIPYGDGCELPIQFKSIYNYLRVNITLKDATEPVTIQRIVFKNAVSNGKFATTAQIVPSKINALQYAATGNWSDGKASASTEVLVASTHELDAEKAAASDYEKAAKTFETATATALVQQSGATAAIVLSIKGGVTLKAGENFNAYVLLPYGTYTNGISYDIYSDKGVTDGLVLKPSTGSLELKAGRSAAASCEVNFTVNNNSFARPDNFEIASDQDWADAVDFVTENYNLYGNDQNWATPTFTLLKDVKGTLPAFRVDIATDNNKLTLTGENTLNGAYAYDLTNANIVNEGTLTVANAGASAPSYTVKSLENKGKVTVNGDLAITTTLVNTGTFTNAGKTTVATTTTNGDATSKVAAVLTNTGAFTSTGVLTNNANATINVNQNAQGSFTLSAASTNDEDAKIVIANGATLTASAAALTNKGTITLTSAAELAGGLNNENGVIVITDASKAYKLTVPASGKSGIIKTTVSTLEGIKAAQTKVDASTANKLINRIELTKSIQVKEALDMTGADLSLAEGVELDINNSVTVTCKNLVIAGAGASVAPYSADGSVDEPTATLTAGTVEVEDGGSFTVAEGITVGSSVTALTVGKSASLTNEGTIAASGADQKIAVKVGQGGSLVNGAEATVTGQFNISENAGTITNNNAATAITVAGSMVGKMEGNFAFTSAN